MTTLVGFVGFAGSGKGAVSEIMINNFGYRKYAFADPLKDAVAAIFGWDRALLEGDTKESRFWREQNDPFWQKRLGMKKFTPRDAMQMVGTDALRHIINPELWVFALFKRWNDDGCPDAVITDCRFPNEINFIRENSGKVVRVQRGPDPEWYGDVLWYNQGHADEDDKRLIGQLRSTGSIPHESETAWIGCDFDEKIQNDFQEMKDLEEYVLKKFGGTAQTSLF